MAEPIERPLGGGMIYVGPMNHVLDRAKDRANSLAATMRPFAKLLSTFVFIM